MDVTKPVDFSLCKECVHYEKLEKEEPCAECLNNFSNMGTNQPTHFVKKQVGFYGGRKK